MTGIVAVVEVVRVIIIVTDSLFNELQAEYLHIKIDVLLEIARNRRYIVNTGCFRSYYFSFRYLYD